MHYESGVGHIGGNLSALDIMMCLYHNVLEEEDTFVLSKGHAVGALDTTLWSTGKMTDNDLKQFHKDGTKLPGHPPAKGLAEVQFGTGSLGHGLSLAAGLALGKRLRGENSQVYCLTSDGEWNEGSTWEALIFACHNKLTNLTFVIDANGLQGFGSTKEVADLDSITGKLRSFGLPAVEINGHNLDMVTAALGIRNSSGPRAIVAQTTKGHGISFMEDKMEWHYLPLTTEQFQEAIAEVAQMSVS